MKLKVYGGTTFINRKQVRAIIATYSLKIVSAKTGKSSYDLKKNWSITNNKDEVKIATENINTVFVSELNYPYKYIPLQKK